MGGGRWSSFCNPTKTRKELAKERSCSTKNWYVSYFNDVMRFLHHCMRLKTKVFRYLWRTYLFRDSKLSNLKKNINKHAVKRLHFIQFLIIPHWSKCQAKFQYYYSFSRVLLCFRFGNNGSSASPFVDVSWNSKSFL